MEKDLIRMQELAGLKEAKLDTPNKELNDLVKQVIAISGFKPYQMEVISAYNEYFINLPVKAIPVSAMIRLGEILPEGSSIGVWGNLNSGALSIRTPYQVR
jgi:hypothetical protein